MCSRQLNKLEITFKSIARTIDQKKKEFAKSIRDFYAEQKSQLEYDKLKTAKFLQKVGTLQEEFSHLEKSLEVTAYEEFYKILSEKASELNFIQE